MAITFNDESHTYRNSDGKILISVTQLLHKHGLAPDYSNVDAELLKEKAQYGNLVHKEIENYCKNKELGETTEFELFAEWLKANNVEVIASEKLVHNDNICGTCDLILYFKDTYIIKRCEVKTTYSKNIDYVSRQLSCYEELDDLKTDEFICFFFNTKQHTLVVENISKKPRAEIKRLFEAEELGITYVNGALSTIDKAQLERVVELQNYLIDIETKQKEYKAELDNIKDQLQSFMETNGIKTFENDAIRLTVRSGSTKETVDTAKLKTEYKDIYDKCKKTTQTKSSLLLTIKRKEIN